jgi:hypothetical protein
LCEATCVQLLAAWYCRWQRSSQVGHSR